MTILIQKFILNVQHNYIAPTKEINSMAKLKKDIFRIILKLVNEFSIQTN